MTADIDETLAPGTLPADGVADLAVRKGEAVARLFPADTAVISSDTLVELDGAALGKPKNEEDAKAMLRALSGRRHYVRTGVALHFGGKVYAGVASTAVQFRKLTDKEIDAYVATGEPMDKAGAYGIQGFGGALVASTDGDFDTVMGFSRALFGKLLKEAGLALPDDAAKRKAKGVVNALKEIYPEAVCALDYGKDPWKLLVMGRLSAQCTDKRVNEVCKELFAKYTNYEEMAEANVADVEEIVKPCGLYHMKAADLVSASRMLRDTYGGKLPADMAGLLTLPGVGRKIANLLLGDIYGLPAVVCDTHCIRICGRLGFYPETLKDPVKIEKILRDLLPSAEGSDFCHRIVNFGRDVCTARAPACEGCPLRLFCDHAVREGKGDLCD